MAENAFQTKTDAQLLAIGEQAAAAIAAGGDPGYGVPAAQTTALTAANTALGSAITTKQAARDASKAATQQALTARTSILEALSAIGATIYNNPDVTNQMIAEAGYAVHDTAPTKHFPSQPSSLIATPDASGTVLLGWDGGSNVYGTSFVIEGRASESDPWTFVTTTTRQRVSVAGFTPGQTYWFRVSASHNGQNSTASMPVAIWGETQVTLEVAA
jgi:hypothetical protein